MKLNLVIGDKVYDQLMFPNQEGMVVEIDNYLLTIKFNDKEYYYPYKDDGEDLLHNHFPPQLSTTPYQIVGMNAIYT